MRVAIVHYHLRRGGVTRVIAHALQALPPGSCRPVLLCGEAPVNERAWPCPVRVLPGLAYDAPAPVTSPGDLARDLADAAREALGGPPDLWHLHNHSLGKSAALTGAVDHLARAGGRLVLQIHDLPEDGRPANYDHLARWVASPWYPSAPHVQYVFINPRDAAFFRSAGLPDDRLHRLPNAVHVDGAEAPDPGGDPGLFLYPTRAIRRKNLGEFLYRAAGAEPGQRFAVTLAPRNPAARPVYERWVEVSRSLRLPVTFAVGEDPARSFAEVVRTAGTVVTTSVAEGFGLAFLEPWLLGRPLAGRNLPEITGAFSGAGVRLPGLYERLEVALGRVDLPGLTLRLDQALRGAYAAYRRPVPARAVDGALGSMIQDGRIDFGRLDEQEQERVLRQGGPDQALRAAADADQVAANARAIAAHFGLAGYGKHLLEIYRRAAAAPDGPVEALSVDALLDAFLDPARFHLLRT